MNTFICKECYELTEIPFLPEDGNLTCPYCKSQEMDGFEDWLERLSKEDRYEIIKQNKDRWCLY